MPSSWPGYPHGARRIEPRGGQLPAPPARLPGGAACHLGSRKLYLLRNQSRGKGIGFFEAGEFYPDFILWLADGPKQRIVFVDPKGLIMLKPNNFSHPKIQVFHTLQEIAARIGTPNVTLDAFIISGQPYEKIRLDFDSGAHTQVQFTENHILFPGNPGLVRKILAA